MASLRLRKADAVLLVKRPGVLDPGKKQCFSFTLKAGGKPMPQVQRSQVGEIPSSSANSSLFVLFTLSTDCIRPTPVLERAICFTQSIDLYVKLIQKHPHRKKHPECLTKCLVTHDPVKSLPKMNCHNLILTNYNCKDLVPK